jgi:hypothetical protein
MAEKKTSFIKWGYTITRNSKGRTFIMYELGMAVWERWSDDGPESSKRLILESSHPLRLTLAFNDTKKNLKTKETQWVTSTGLSKKWDCNVGHVSVFVLDAPKSDQDSWGKIKQIIKE